VLCWLAYWDFVLVLLWCPTALLSSVKVSYYCMCSVLHMIADFGCFPIPALGGLLALLRLLLLLCSHFALLGCCCWLTLLATLYTCYSHLSCFGGCVLKVHLWVCWAWKSLVLLSLGLLEVLPYCCWLSCFCCWLCWLVLPVLCWLCFFVYSFVVE